MQLGKKRKKGHHIHIEKKEIKLSPCIDELILYTENPAEFTKRYY